MFDINSGKWILIEANRPWSSGFYGCNPTDSLNVVEYSCEYSCEYSGSRWQWKPDSHLTHLNSQYETLKIEDKDFLTSDFSKYKNTDI